MYFGDTGLADLAIRLGRMLRSVGLNAQLFASIPDFLKTECPNTPACLVLDIRLPGKAVSTFSASSPQQHPSPDRVHYWAGDVPMTVQAMKGGAIEFLTKPFRIRICLMLYN